MSRDREGVGVVLLNLGGPERLAEVEPFLVNLFADRSLIRLGPFPFLQGYIARRIARKRAPKSREAYRLIGGGSPLSRITRAQARALEEELSRHGRFLVRPVMRYWPPFASQVLPGLAGAGITRLVALPLYPHFSRATSGSSLDDLARAAQALSPEAPEIAVVEPWPDQPGYVAALAATIQEGLVRFGEPAVQVVYSAHSLPARFIDEGDPYLDHLQRTIAAVGRLTGTEGRLCFQSRSGPVKWLGPSTPETLAELAAAGVKNVLMVPISFVSDHVETLYEIDILYRRQAGELGMRLERSVSLNTRPDFIRALAGLVADACRQRGWWPEAA